MIRSLHETLYKTLFIWLIAVFVFSAPGWAGTAPVNADQTDRGTSPAAVQAAPRWAHDGSDLKPDSALVYGNLPNGFRYVLMKNSTPKDRVSMHLDVQAGSIYETDDQRGLAHYLEHMLFNGSTHFQPGELVKYFQRIGMDFGPDANASTGFDRTVYDILLPKGDAKSIGEGLTVLQDYAEGALLLESEIDRERNVILAEKRSRDSVGYRTFQASIQFEMPETLVPKRLPIGIRETIEKADQKLLKDFYDAWYRPEKMVLVMVGDFDIPAAEAMIKKRFSAMSARSDTRQKPDLGPIHHEGIRPFVHQETEAGNTEVTIQVIQKISHEPDSVKVQQDDIVQDIANTMLDHRLDRLVRKPDAPFTSASSGTGLFLKEIFYGYITADCSGEKWQSTLFQLEQSLRQALTFGFTDAELNRVKKEYIAAFEKAVNKASTRKSNALARQIIRHVNTGRVFQSPKQIREQFAPFVNGLTIKQVNDAFREIWHPAHRLVAVTGNAQVDAEGASPEQVVQNVFEESSQVAVAKPEQKEAAAFPYLAVPEAPGKIIQKNVIADLGIIQVDFENGLRLNLKKTDFKADEVLAKLIIGPGRSQEPIDKPGLAELSEAVINESGLGGMDRETLNAALAGTNTHVSFSIGDSYSVLTAKSVSKEMPLLFQLLYAHAIDPAYRADAYQLSMERFEQGYDAMTRRIEGAMTLKGRRFLAGGDSRFGLPDADVFKELKLEDVKQWAARLFTQGPVELSIAGDFDEKTVIELASRYLGGLSPDKTAESLSRPLTVSFPSGDELAVDVATRISKGEVHLVFPTDDIWDIQRTRRIAALASVVSDRLREEIREEMGATYSAYAYNAPSRTYTGYGLFNIGITVSPSQIEPVLNRVKQMTGQLVSGSVSKDELKRALEPTLTGIKDMRQENAYWLNTVMTGSRLHPEQIEWSRTIQSDYASITVEDVMKMARQYLQNEKAAVMIVRPEKQAVTDAGASPEKG